MASPDVQQLVSLLNSSLDPKEHKQAEASLREAENSQGFILTLLQIVAAEEVPLTTRLAAALCFKNFVRRSWTDEDGNHKLPSDEVTTVKRDIVGLMISVPSQIQSQLGDAISVIADSDFFKQWDTLTQDLVSRFSPNQPAINNGVLTVAHSIFKRWRPLMRTDELYTEINHVQTTFMEPFLNLMQQTDAAIDANGSDKTLLAQHLATLNLEIKILHDLTSQDIPQILVDNLTGIVALLEKYLTYDNLLVHTGDDAEAGPIEYVKAAIFGLLSLWVAKYDEDVKEYVPRLISTSWNLLTTTGLEPKYDIMTSRAMNFLTRVASSSEHIVHFDNESILNQIIEKVVVPNVALRESDIELFEDEPIEFIRRDLEGTESETRRKAATDLLRQLLQKFIERVTGVVQQYINHYLQEYASDQTRNWRSKDTAVYLFSSIAALDAVTTMRGAGRVNPHLDVIDFFQKSIAQDLVSDSAQSILQMDAIKYLYIFRGHLTSQHWSEAFPMMIQHLKSPDYVVYTYCAIAIERVLSYTSEQTHEPLVSRTLLLNHAKEILQRIFSIIEKNTAPEKVQENEFLMRTVMRVLIVAREDANTHADFLLQNLTAILKVIRHNPSNPRFYYYLFEAIGAFIRFCAPAEPAKFEETLYPPFAEILSQGVEEFIPYIFQLFAALLEANPKGQLSQLYTSLISPVLNVQAWEARGNTPALTRFLCALLSRGSEHILQENKLDAVLGVFQNLISKKSTDMNGFELMETIATTIPPETMKPYYPQVFSILLGRLSNSRTDSFAIRFVRLYYLMSALPQLGVDFIIEAFEAVQAGVYTQLYMGVILPETQKLLRPLDRKTAVVALTNTLTSSEAFANKYAKGWAYTVEALLKLMLNPPDLSRTDGDNIQDQDVDDVGFGVGFTQLNTCRPPVKDFFSDVKDLKAYIGQQLRQADQQSNGKISKFVQERLNDETRSTLANYMQN